MKKLANWIVAILFIICMFCIMRYLQNQNLTSVESETNEDVITITVLAGQSSSDAGIEDMIDEALAEKFPNVQLEWECVDWGEKFDTQMQVRIAAGDIPDIMVGKAQDIETYAAEGNLAPISTNCTKRIKEEALQSVKKDGVVYGLPYNVLYQGVIYNKNIFEHYGLKPPTTRKELEDIELILEKNQTTPFAAHFWESWMVGNMTMQFFMNDIFRDRPNWGDLFRTGEESFFNNNQMKDCLLQNQNILAHSWDDAMMIDQYECDQRFFEGEAAMYLTGSWSLQLINQYNENLNQEYGIFPYPNQKGNSNLLRETNMTFMKSSTTQYDDLIDQILEELVTNEELIQDILDFTQAFSTIKGIESKYQRCIEEDVNWYEQNNQVMDVSTGNKELIWSFQNDLAVKQQEWLQGKIALEDVLHYADDQRMESSQ
ncbi:ABC-type glycerol-3-phosphate transport system substrate-binding protein [Lachnotalea glycerini]|uniref:ABC-type glycerol-3-phosphate transport system substrate-binding protein n=1 Tax=Lachnotalea glycerini TaxID=1763509 RepID=A0A318EQQ2_9FIRM|nr:extracellular solute-binding protein [Lachnotalea glycerini]PXV93805.1 ABC-type glycerol-3-phosphate transport system substrate-binding protein [Lachnotalea glycerini]